jgi:hypothetical protein
MRELTPQHVLIDLFDSDDFSGADSESGGGGRDRHPTPDRCRLCDQTGSIKKARSKARLVHAGGVLLLGLPDEGGQIVVLS